MKNLQIVEKAFMEDETTSSAVHESRPSLFEEGRNCWKSTLANHAAVVVDCANYYRNLYESMMKARHSIFITGWDIDSRIGLMRPEGEAQITLFDVIVQKATENPNLQIYMNKWDYAFFMAPTREPAAFWRWKATGLKNIHYIHDNVTPAGACHHQKIIVMDDEVAYSGGMDIAIGRWDTRAHSPKELRRVDPGGVLRPNSETVYAPYHDIMTVVSGEPARYLAEMSRLRWKMAAGYDAIPVREVTGRDVPHCWPDTDPPDFYDIPVAIARTWPKYGGAEEAFEIEQVYLDQIARAKNFIYMENQYFTRKNIAYALNRAMRNNPDLRILLVSSFDPQGFVEKIGMWTGRLTFKRILRRGGVGRQVCLAYPVTQESGRRATTRIHSKFMIVDDAFMHIGSANINNRSMRFDTECDLVFQSANEKHARKIADVRNDLIREHTGYDADVIEDMIAQKVYPADFLPPKPDSTQHLVRVDDRIFFGKFTRAIRLDFTDPDNIVFPANPLTTVMPSGWAELVRKRILLVCILAACALLLMAVLA